MYRYNLFPDSRAMTGKMTANVFIPQIHIQPPSGIVLGNEVTVSIKTGTHLFSVTLTDLQGLEIIRIQP